MIKERELEAADIDGSLRKGVHIGMVRIKFVWIDERNGVMEIGIEKAGADITVDKD